MYNSWDMPHPVLDERKSQTATCNSVAQLASGRAKTSPEFPQTKVPVKTLINSVAVVVPEPRIRL